MEVSKMSTNQKTGETLDMKTKLSTLWTFAMFNYLYADVLMFMRAENLQAFIAGMIGSTPISEGFLLGAAILMETAIAMVLLSRVLQYRTNRWANIVVGTLHTVAVLASMFVGTGSELYYLFFGTIETICTAYIVWSAWRWPQPKTSDDPMQIRSENLISEMRD
jgi:hypothetical protein